MNELQVFGFEGRNVRVVEKDGSPWWVLADVCAILGIGNPSDVSARLDADQKNTLGQIEGITGNPNKTIVNEPGLYSVIFRSEKPEAARFRKWVFTDVLPAIRKTGGYGKINHTAAEMREFRLMFKGKNEIPAEILAGYLGCPVEIIAAVSKVVEKHDTLSNTADPISIILDAQAYGAPAGTTYRDLLAARTREADATLQLSDLRRYKQEGRWYFIISVNSRDVALILKGVAGYDRLFQEHRAFVKSGAARINGNVTTARFFDYDRIMADR